MKNCLTDGLARITSGWGKFMMTYLDTSWGLLMMKYQEITAPQSCAIKTQSLRPTLHHNTRDIFNQNMQMRKILSTSLTKGQNKLSQVVDQCVQLVVGGAIGLFRVTISSEVDCYHPAFTRNFDDSIIVSLSLFTRGYINIIAHTLILVISRAPSFASLHAFCWSIFGNFHLYVHLI